MKGRQFFIDGLRFVCTGDVSPEQYNIFDREKQIAYARVRWSYFSCHLLDTDGKLGPLVYGVPINGYGCFDPVEREEQLQQAVNNIKLALVTENEDSGV